MKLRVIENEQDLLSIEKDWNNLAYYSTNDFNWIYQWWLNHKENNHLKVIIAERNKEIVGIAPLFIENARALRYFKVKKLTFLGARIADNLDIVLKEDEYKEQTFQTILRHIFENLNFDMLELNQINSGCPNFNLWQKYAPGLFNIEFQIVADNHKINLSEFKSYDEYFNQLSKNHRTNLKRIQKKIQKEFQNVEYQLIENITDTDINIMADLNIKRQLDLINKGNIERKSYFIDERAKNFFKDYLCNDKSDIKFLYYLKCDGKVLAYNLSLMNNNIITGWNMAFDPDYKQFSPQKLLINEIVKYAFKNNYKYLNFMCGSESYKHDWSNKLSTIYDLVKLNSIKARLIFGFRQFLPDFMLTKFYSSSYKEMTKNNLNRNIFKKRLLWRTNVY